MLVPVNRRLLGGFVVAQLVDPPSVGDLAVNDGVEGFRQSTESLVNGLPLCSGEVDTVINLVPQSACSGVMSTINFGDMHLATHQYRRQPTSRSSPSLATSRIESRRSCEVLPLRYEAIHECQ